jgi:hypothetical protein
VLVKARLYPVIRDTSHVLRALMPANQAASARREGHTA